MALMLMQVLVVGVIAAADDAPLTRYWSARALLPCVVPDAARAAPRRPPPPPLLDDAPRPGPYSWRRDDQPYHANRVLSNGTLDVRRREGGDGVFQCAVRAHAGTVLGYPVRLVTAHLEFISHPEDTTAYAGQPALMTCSVGSEPPAAVTWSRDGKALPEDDRYFLLKDQLLITDVRDSDAGMYRCTATNAFLNKTRSSHGGRLRVLGEEDASPSFLSTLEERELMVPEGEGIVLPCPVAGWPRPQLSWELVTPGGYTTTLDAADQVLQRSDLDPNQEGVYTCQVKGRSDLTKSFNVTVTQPATITAPPQSKEALRASTVRLSCSAAGRPAPTVTWYKDGRPLALTGRISLRRSSHEDRIELVISGVTSPDAGVYQCFARNSFSVASAWAALGVRGAGGAAPPARVACQPLGARDVAVHWTNVTDKVFAYTVHTMPQEKPGMSLPGQPHVNTQEIVTVPKPLTPYLFQVRAYVQSGGSNTATDFSEAVVCQGQGVPFQLSKLNNNTLLVSWRNFSLETPGVAQWVLQWRAAPGQEHNVTLPAATTNYSLPLQPDVPLQIRLLGSRFVPWLSQNLSRVPWMPADLSGSEDYTPRDLEVSQVGARSMTVRWRAAGPARACAARDGDDHCAVSDTNSVTIQDLQPDSRYEVRVVARPPGREPVEALLPHPVFTLSEGSASLKLSYKFVNGSTVRVSWRGEPARYTVSYTQRQPVQGWSTVAAVGNTALLSGIEPTLETLVRVQAAASRAESPLLRIPAQTNHVDAKELSYVFTADGVVVSWSGGGARAVRYAQNITAPLEAWRTLDVTEPRVQLVGLDPWLPTYVTVTAPGSGRPAQVLSIPARPAPATPLPLVVGMSCLACALVLIVVGAICFWRRRKMAQSPVRTRRRNASLTESPEGEGSEMKSTARTAGAAGEPLLNGHVHITENPTSKTPNGKMRRARYDAFDVSRHDADTTAETTLGAASLGLLDTSRPLPDNNSFSKLPDDNMNSELAELPTLQPNG